MVHNMEKNSYQKGNEFERNVLKILYRTNPYKISHRNGGGDRGRDILVTYMIDNVLYDVIVQCKYYSHSLNVSHISSSIDWAKIHRPCLFYLWVSPYLTSDAKDYIANFSEVYNIPIDYEEQENIDEYLNEMKEPNSRIMETLRFRIISNIKKHQFYLEQYSNSSSFFTEEIYLQDRTDTKKILLSNKKYAYYIQGVSCCGKTQLLKYVGYIYHNKHKQIFWHTIHETSLEVQLKSFWTSLSHFFCVVYHSDDLKQYFQEYGYHATDVLYNMALYLLEKYNPIIIIDDVHKCAENNFELRDFWISIIEKRSCLIYFAGWFNIFEPKLSIQKNLKTIILEGLEVDDLNAIILHNTGTSMIDIANKIASDYAGLPGFAILVDTKTTAKDFESDDTFLFSIVDYLNEEEKKVLFSFVHSSNALPVDLFIELNYREAFYSLLQRKLIIKQIQDYRVHDKYKTVLSKYNMNYNLCLAVIEILNSYSVIEISCILDIAQIYLKYGKNKKAFEILNCNFEKMLHKQLSLELLHKYQLIENGDIGNIDFKDLLLRKAVLLERCEKYDLCKIYLDILENSVEQYNTEWETLFYLKLRCYYFSNEYDMLLKLVFSNIEQLPKISFRTYAQTFLLVGRIYYIRGLFSEALYFYLIAYECALSNHDNILMIKVIHRIAMIEQKLGFVTECKETFEYILSLNELISPKRKSYILYRIAECNYTQGNYQEALEKNNDSIKIKKSINHSRGLIFSYRLAAKISLKEKKYMDAERNINIAINIAQELNLHKDEIACLIFYIRLLERTKSDMQTSICDEINDYIKIAQKEKLLYRLKQIATLFTDNYKISCAIDKVNDIIPELVLELTKEFHVHQKYCENLFPSMLKIPYENLRDKKQSISKELLLLSGLYTSLETL